MKILYLLPFLFGVSVPVFSQQIISDKQIGKTLGQVLYGEKEMNTAIRYLNNMGVPVGKIENVMNYPDIVNAVNSYKRKCG